MWFPTCKLSTKPSKGNPAGINTAESLSRLALLHYITKIRSSYSGGTSKISEHTQITNHRDHWGHQRVTVVVPRKTEESGALHCGRHVAGQQSCYSNVYFT